MRYLIFTTILLSISLTSYAQESTKKDSLETLSTRELQSFLINQTESQEAQGFALKSKHLLRAGNIVLASTVPISITALAIATSTDDGSEADFESRAPVIGTAVVVGTLGLVTTIVLHSISHRKLKKAKKHYLTPYYSYSDQALGLKFALRLQ